MVLLIWTTRRDFRGDYEIEVNKMTFTPKIQKNQEGSFYVIFGLWRQPLHNRTHTHVYSIIL